MINYYEVIVEEGEGEKEILLIVDDEDQISHIYTIGASSSDVALKKPVHYKEKIERAISRLGARDDTEIYEIDHLQALDCAFRANRTSVASSILKKMRSYRRRGETRY